MGEDEIIDLINSHSWEGKAGGYDLAGASGKFGRVVDGEEVTVLGFSNRAMHSLGSFLN